MIPPPERMDADRLYGLLARIGWERTIGDARPIVKRSWDEGERYAVIAIIESGASICGVYHRTSPGEAKRFVCSSSSVFPFGSHSQREFFRVSWGGIWPPSGPGASADGTFDAVTAVWLSYHGHLSVFGEPRDVIAGVRDSALALGLPVPAWIR